MVNLIEKAKKMLEIDEKILEEVIVQRLLESASTLIFLTNKRIIYWRCGFWKKAFESINLSEVSGVTYLPKPLHSAGLIKVITKSGKNILISPSYVNSLEADDFIKKVKKRIN